MTTPKKPPAKAPVKTVNEDLAERLKAATANYNQNNPTAAAAKKATAPAPAPAEKVKLVRSEEERQALQAIQSGKDFSAGVTGAPKSSPNTAPTQAPAEEAQSPIAQAAVQTLDPATVEETLNSVRDLSCYEDNVLHQFDNTAYHARLYMTVDRDVSKRFFPDYKAPDSVGDYYAQLDKFKQVTIAESGASSYNIQNLTIESLVSPGFQSVALGSNSIVMTILEPGGVSFLDALKNAALELQTRDVRRCWLYLEITFRGYEGAERKSNLLAGQEFDNDGRWIWQVQVTDIETKLAAGGGEYKLSMIPYNETSYDSDARCIPDLLIIEGNTIEEFFNDLKEALNTAWELRTGTNLYRSYEFKFHGVKGRKEVTGESITQFSIRPEDEGRAYIRDRDLKGGGETPTDTKEAPKEDVSTVEAPATFGEISVSPQSGKPRGQFARGTSIDEIVTAAFQCSPEAITLVKNAKTDNPDAPDENMGEDGQEGRVNENGFRESIIWRLEPEVEVQYYDPIFNSYGKKITYHIYGYVTQAPILTRSQIIQANDDEVQKRMLATIVKQKLLRKKYDYLFTGLNTDILDLDISFNLLWAAALPRLLRNEALRAQSIYDADAIDNYKKALDQVARLGEVSADRDSAKEELATAETDEQKAAATEKLQVAESERKTQADNLNKLRNKLIEKFEFDDKTAFNSTRTFAEDLTPSELPDLRDISIALSYSQEEPRQAVAKGMVGQPTNGAAIFGTVMNQLQGPMSSQMISITLEIVGDPYWIGPANMEQVVLRRRDADPTKVADYTVGDNVFVLTFSYPLGVNEDGSPKLQKNEVFTGLYRVTKVTHKFADGKFTQTLAAIRMPLIDLYRATANTGAKE